MRFFTKEQICEYLAKHDLPMEPAFELRKISMLDGADLSAYQNALSMYHNQVIDSFDLPRPYLAQDLPPLVSNVFSIDRLSDDDNAFLYRLFECNLNKLAKSSEEFKRHYKRFIESEGRPVWDLVRVLVSDTDYNYLERQSIYDGLLLGGLVARISRNDVIQLDDNTYELPKRFDIGKPNPTNKIIYPFRARYYCSIGNNLAEYWCTLNKGKTSELDKIKYSLHVTEIINDALIRGELPVHRLPDGIIIEFKGYPAPSDGDVIYWHEIKPVLTWAGVGVPDEPVFMADWHEAAQNESAPAVPMKEKLDELTYNNEGMTELTAQYAREKQDNINAGRLTIEEVAQALSNDTGLEFTRWIEVLVKAIENGVLPLKNPKDPTDNLPYQAPIENGKPNIRTFYDRLSTANVNKWLDDNPDYAVLRFTESKTEPAVTVMVGVGASTDDVQANEDYPQRWRYDTNLTKSEKQKRAILEVIKIKGFDPMKIPDGEKGTLRIICGMDYQELFDGDTSFDNCWKIGNNKDWRMANYASYAKRGR